jgi:hypothetical protein
MDLFLGFIAGGLIGLWLAVLVTRTEQKRR